MTPQEILRTVRRLPPENQREVLEALQNEVGGQAESTVSERVVQRLLFERGVIGNLPNEIEYTDDLDDFEPVALEGTPLSESVIEERR